MLILAAGGMIPYLSSVPPPLTVSLTTKYPLFYDFLYSRFELLDLIDLTIVSFGNIVVMLSSVLQESPKSGRWALFDR